MGFGLTGLDQDESLIVLTRLWSSLAPAADGPGGNITDQRALALRVTERGDADAVPARINFHHCYGNWTEKPDRFTFGLLPTKNGLAFWNSCRNVGEIDTWCRCCRWRRRRRGCRSARGRWRSSRRRCCRTPKEFLGKVNFSCFTYTLWRMSTVVWHCRCVMWCNNILS